MCKKAITSLVKSHDYGPIILLGKFRLRKKRNTEIVFAPPLFDKYRSHRGNAHDLVGFMLIPEMKGNNRYVLFVLFYNMNGRYRST